MKSLLIPALLLTLAPLAQSAELCGQLYTTGFSPPCVTQFCAHQVSIELEIEKQNGKKVLVTPASGEVSDDAYKLVGKAVCADGEYKKMEGSEKYFEATAIQQKLPNNEAE
jgi:hypothetical protein